MIGVVIESTPLCNQEPATLLEYSMNAVTAGIDAIATTRVLIRGEKSQLSTHASTGETVQRTFRYGMFIMFAFVQLTMAYFVLQPPGSHH